MQINEPHHFYVYEHIRQDTGAVFYVGKGKGDRASQGASRRSEYWRRIAAKAGGFSVRLLVSDIDDELALLAEMERISQLRALGAALCNLTDGGDGMSGYIRSPECCARIGAAHKGKFMSPEVRAKISAAVRATGYRHPPDVRAKMSADRKGQQLRLGAIQSPEERERRASKMRGRSATWLIGTKRTESQRMAVSVALKGRPQEKKACPHCGKTGGNSMARWHFDACKKRAP